ncbi:MAG: energy-coupled thiamine transporter ThiT [Coriobacteriia bacterium]|nr:energy-coupled thiamine transporter ThiT [Coriobacteriia bacterium]
MQGSRVRIAAEIGLTIALSAVLGLIGVWQMPQGGSLSFTMLPIFVLALLRGPAVGVTAGALYGLVDLALEPYVYHPLQVLLDYPVAYGLCGLAGVFAASAARLVAADRFTASFWRASLPGIALGAIGRYAAHVTSGLVFFSSYAIEAGQAPLVYSGLYNSFVLVSATASAFVAFAVLPPLMRLFGGHRS